MAYLLTIQPHSPLKRSFNDMPYFQSNSPKSMHSSDRKSSLFTAPNVSATSLVSLPSYLTSPWTQSGEHFPSPLVSHSLLHLFKGLAANRSETNVAANHSRELSWGSVSLTPASFYNRSIHDLGSPTNKTVHVPDPFAVSEIDDDESEIASTCPRTSTETTKDEYISCRSECTADEADESRDSRSSNPKKDHPLTRWLSTLRRRNTRQDGKSVQRHSNENEDQTFVASETRGQRSISACGSIGFVTGVKSASITMTNTTIAMRRDCRSIRSRYNQGPSDNSDARVSLDSFRPERLGVTDAAAFERAKQRGETIAELISTEESYIGDMKALINVYFTLLASVPSISPKIRRCFHRNLCQIVELHEELVEELHQTVPRVDRVQLLERLNQPRRRARHTRWKSADAISDRLSVLRLSRKGRMSLDAGDSSTGCIPGYVVDTATAGAVAAIFTKFMRRFFIYEEYSAHMEEMKSDLQYAEGISPLKDYERGTEALSTPLLSLKGRETISRKGLHVSDLLIKPIQRITKYPLLFENLCKYTPVYDDPEAHAELEKALSRLRETSQEINKATDSPRTRRMIEASWILQDRFLFSNTSSHQAMQIRLLGHVILCGVLHITFESENSVKGQYMICALYKSSLVLANLCNGFYQVVAVLPLAGGFLEEADNGSGIQCYTTSFTWKFVFESQHRLYELIMSACSEAEEAQWRKHLHDRILAETRDFAEGRVTAQEHFSLSSLEIKSIATVFGHPDNFARKSPVHRAATVGVGKNLRQVVIKNTQAQKAVEERRSSASLPVTRSRSHTTNKCLQTLAPRRMERIKLENAMAEVWTKDVLPYPAMAPSRPENSIRASANSVMRKLSMASIASNLTRMSSSQKRMNRPRSDDVFTVRRKTYASRGRKTSLPSTMRLGEPKIVDFHTAPQAFLPTDFEINHQTIRRARRASIRTANSDLGRPHPRRMSISSTFMQRTKHWTELSNTNEERKPILSIPLQGNSILDLADVQRERVPMSSGVNRTHALHHGSFTKRLAKQRSRLLKIFG